MCTTQGQHITLQKPRTRTTLVWACLWVWAWLWMGVRGGCPKMCECFWRDSKETAACREADFIDIPRGLEATTQVLDLSHNNLRILPRDAFVYTGITSLQKVVLSHCKLFLLEAGSFNSVENVMELDLSYNKLRKVPSAALKGLVMLRELSLSHNAISTLSAIAFIHIHHIVQLDLSQNGLDSVAIGSLRELSDLEILNVADNKLTYFNASEFELLPLLRVIRLDGNPWRCSCHIRPLRQWFHDRNLVASIPPSCSYPKWLVGRDWQLLDREDLLCAPLVTAIAPRVLAAHGENVSLLCRIETEVETTITWLVGDVPLFNDSDLTRYLVLDLVTANNVSYVSNLTITDVVSEDQGTYRCLAENRAGVREANFTLQVSHDVAEVRVATVSVSYMKEGLLGGMSALIIVLVLICSVVYCKVRVGREPRHDDDSVDTAQSSRGSECEMQHKLAGYHVVPTNDMEDSSPRRQQQQQDATWNIREGAGEERQGVVSEGAVATLQPTPLPFLDGTKGEACGVREATQLVVRHNDVFTHRVCSRSVSQVSLTNASHYPDLLDLPPSQLQHHVTLQEPNQILQGLSAAACSVRNFLPCRRTYSDAGCLAGAGVVVRGEVNHDLQPLASSTPYTQDNPDSSRSSSALNLALSQAASNAYANAQLAATAGGGHGCVGGVAPLLHHQGDRNELVVGEPGSPEGGGVEGSCSQHLHTADPCHFEYHAAQLEKFLKEYRCLQEQLNHMKQSYEAHKRAGSVPSLECCPQGPGGHRTTLAVFPDGTTPCCSCSHPTTQAHPAEFTETSLTEAAATPGYPEPNVSPLLPGAGYPAVTEAQIVVTGEVKHIDDPTTQGGGYTEGYRPYQFVENMNPQIPEITDSSKLQPVDVQVGSPVRSSPARGSPKSKTSLKSNKEPLKSILKKNTDGTGAGAGGRRRGAQWARTASCCDTRPVSHALPSDTNYPTADLYPAGPEPSYQPAESHQKTSDALTKVVDQSVPPPGLAHAHFES